MANRVCLDNRYSTTRMVTKLSTVTAENPEGFDDKKNIGGLRTKGYYKYSTEYEPLVTVITVVMNGVIHFEQSLLSVINQTYNNVEYIIIDGCSTDGTIDIIHKYDHCIDYWISEHDNGIYDAINKGITLSTGDYIAVLQSDDWYELDIINAIVDEILKHKHQTLKVIYANYTIVNEIYSTFRKFNSTLEYWLGMTISHQAMFISSDVYEKYGLYNTHYELAADYDYFLKMMTGGVAFFEINHYGVFFRLGGLSTKSNWKSIDEATAINRKYLGRFSKRHILFILQIYKHILYTHILSSLFESFFIKFFGEDRMINIKKRIKKIRNKSINSAS